MTEPTRDDAGSRDAQPADRLRGRAGGSRLKLWFLLEARRPLVAGAVLSAVFGGLLAIGLAVPDARSALLDGDALETLFQALVTATVTGVTLVVTLNQLVLSQELGAVGDQRDRMEGSREFQAAVAEAIDAPVAPAEPATLLRGLLEVVAARAATLGDAIDAADPADGDLNGRGGDLVEGLTRNATQVADDLEGARFGRFEVVSAALDFEYAQKLQLARRIEAEHAGELGPVGQDALRDIVELLELFGPAREHVKTLYFQWELIDLSRAVIVTAVPALVVAAGTVLFLDPRVLPPGAAGFGVVAALVTVALAPFAVLLAYVLRISTVAKRTLSIGAFILRATDRRGTVPWGGD